MPEVTASIFNNLCDLFKTMPRQRSPLSFLIQPVPRQAEDGE